MPTAESNCESFSKNVTTHLPTETSLPTYIKSAIANNQKDALRNRSPASLMGNDSGWAGRGNPGRTTNTSSAAVKTANTQKIVLSAASWGNAFAMNGKTNSPSPKQTSNKLSAELTLLAAMSPTRAWPALTIALAPKPSTREHANIRASAPAAGTLPTIKAKPPIDPITRAEPTNSVNFLPRRSVSGPLMI